MISLTLFLVLFAAVVTVTATKTDQYLIFAIEGKDNDLSFYKTNFDLNTYESILSSACKTPVANWYINHCESGDVLYWICQDSDVIKSLNLSNHVTREANIPGVSEGIFLGPSIDEKLYFYFMEDNKISIYNFKSEILEEEKLDGLVDPDTDLQLIGRYPHHNELIFFAECSDTNNTGKMFDMDKKQLVEVFNLSRCFDKWAIAPNGNRVYGISDLELYVYPPNEGTSESFQPDYVFNEEAHTFAAGNNELFFTTDEYGKIFKLKSKKHGGFIQASYCIPGKVKALILSQINQ